MKLKKKKKIGWNWFPTVSSQSNDLPLPSRFSYNGNYKTPIGWRRSSL